MDTNTTTQTIKTRMIGVFEGRNSDWDYEEILWNNTLWARQYIERGIEELEKLGYLVDTNRYY